MNRTRTFRALVSVAMLTLPLAACNSNEQPKIQATKKEPVKETAKAKPCSSEVTPVAATAPAAAASTKATEKAIAEPEEIDPIPDIPEEHSKPPTHTEWQGADELNTQGPNSQAENCEMKVVREWLNLYCHGDITGFSDMTEFGQKFKDYFVAVRKGKSADFVVRLRRGKTMKLRIQRDDAREAVLYVSWPQSKPKPVHIALGRGNPPEPKEEDKGEQEKQKNKLRPKK